MKLQVEVDDNGTVVNAKFKTYGCGSAIASSSVATEWLIGKKVDDCLSITVSPALHSGVVSGRHLKACLAERGDRVPPEAAAREEALLHAGRGRHQGRHQGLPDQAAEGVCLRR